MKEEFLNIFADKYKLTKEDTGEFAVINLMGMEFKTEKYKAEGLGYISWMSMEGMNGAMKMITAVVTPIDKDLPIFSYDRINAMGKDTFIVELYDTMVTGPFDATPFNKYKEAADAYPSMVVEGKFWYDAIRYPQSLKNVGTSEQTPEIDKIVLGFVKTLADLSVNAPVCDPVAKKTKDGEYSTQLVEHGGAATENFVKGIGMEKTREFFKTVLFNA